MTRGTIVGKMNEKKSDSERGARDRTADGFLQAENSIHVSKMS